MIAFNFAPSGPNFNNPKARVQLVSAASDQPTADDLGRLNDAGELTNSWARWAPFQQSYKGAKLVWITFSSTRNYGLTIDNGGAIYCYPGESPAGFPNFTQTNNCSRTQILMAAIRLDPAAVAAGQDVSWPASRLPFQDIQTNNHLASGRRRALPGPARQRPLAHGMCCDQGRLRALPAEAGFELQER